MGITKQTLRELLSKGTTLESIFEFKEGQDCLIFKAEKFKETEDIIYIPDITLNEIEVTRPLDAEGIDHVIEHCCNGKDFINECRGNEQLAEALFDFDDWQYPCLQDILDGYAEEEFQEDYGCSLSFYQMPKYVIITKNQVYESESEKIVEEIVEEQEEKRKLLGLDGDHYVCHFFDSPYFSDSTEETSIEDAIQRLAIKDGYDMVQFQNGNYGFVAYYNGIVNGFEIVG